MRSSHGGLKPLTIIFIIVIITMLSSFAHPYAAKYLSISHGSDVIEPTCISVLQTM